MITNPPNDLWEELCSILNIWLDKRRPPSSAFKEIIETKRIVGCIYKHPNVLISEFTTENLCPFLEKLSYEKQEVSLLFDFHINLLDYNNDKETSVI